MSNKKYTDITLSRICELMGDDTQEEFADKIGFAQPTISGMFSRNKMPSSSIVHAVAKHYKVSADWLLGLSNTREMGGGAQSHNLTADNLTYADAMAVLERV